MKNTKIQFFTLLAFCLSLLSVTAANAQFDEAAKWVPENANCLVMVQAENILNSAIGRRENWATDRSAAFRSGASFFPPTTKRILMGSQIDFEFMDSVFHVGVFEKKGSEINLVEVSKRVNGNIATIGGKQALELPNNSYLIKVDNTTLVTMTPSNRQMTTRWLAKKSSGRMSVSPYLAEAVKFADENAQVIVAFDLEGVLDPAEIEKRLVEGGSVLEVSAASVAKTLSTLRGVTLGVTVNDRISGAIKIDFDKDITVIGDLAKPILLKILSDRGAFIYEFTDWKVQVRGKTIQMSGPLYESGLRRILSLLDVPPSLQEPAPPADDNDPVAKEKLMGLASQSYFKSVSSLIDDLNHDKQNRQTMGQMSVWFNKYARQIDRLPMVDVDPDMLNYGKFVSESLRKGESAVTKAAAQSRTRQQEVPEQYDVETWSRPVGVTWYGGAYSWDSWRATPNRNRKGQIQAQVRTQERIRGNMDANIVLQHVAEASADIRRYMTARYHIEF